MKNAQLYGSSIDSLSFAYGQNYYKYFFGIPFASSFLNEAPENTPKKYE